MIRTPLTSEPIPILFAATKGTNQDLLDAIDKHLAQWKQDTDSPYHQARKRWLGGERSGDEGEGLSGIQVAILSALVLGVATLIFLLTETRRRKA